MFYIVQDDNEPNDTGGFCDLMIQEYSTLYSLLNTRLLFCHEWEDRERWESYTEIHREPDT